MGHRICYIVRDASIPDTLASSCLPSPVPVYLTLPTSELSAHKVIHTCACMHPKMACSRGCWESCTSQTVLVHAAHSRNVSPPQRRQTWKGVYLSFPPCLTIPFLSRTHLSDHCFSPQGLENPNLFGCLPRHSGKGCALFKCLLCLQGAFGVLLLQCGL